MLALPSPATRTIVTVLPYIIGYACGQKVGVSNTSARDYLRGGCESHAAKQFHALEGGRCAHVVCARECSLKASLTPGVSFCCYGNSLAVVAAEALRSLCQAASLRVCLDAFGNILSPGIGVGTTYLCCAGNGTAQTTQTYSGCAGDGTGQTQLVQSFALYV